MLINNLAEITYFSLRDAIYMHRYLMSSLVFSWCVYFFSSFHIIHCFSNTFMFVFISSLSLACDRRAGSRLARLQTFLETKQQPAEYMCLNVYVLEESVVDENEKMRVKCEHLTCCDFYWVIISSLSSGEEKLCWSERALTFHTHSFARSKFRVPERFCLHVIWLLLAYEKKNELKIYISWELVIPHVALCYIQAIVFTLGVVSNYHKKLSTASFLIKISSAKKKSKQTHIDDGTSLSLNFFPLQDSNSISICSAGSEKKKKQKESVDAVDHLKFKTLSSEQNVLLRRE